MASFKRMVYKGYKGIDWTRAGRSHKHHARDVWEWKQPLGKGALWRYAAWCAILEVPSLLEEVLPRYVPAVLDVGYLSLTSLEGLAVLCGWVLLRSALDVPNVKFSFT